MNASSTDEGGSSNPSAVRTRVTTRVASRESPPRSKKLSPTPTVRPKTSLQIPARTSSAWLAGGRSSRGAALSGSGIAASARRSILPLGVSGSHRSRTKPEGSM